MVNSSQTQGMETLLDTQKGDLNGKAWLSNSE